MSRMAQELERQLKGLRTRPGNVAGRASGAGRKVEAAMARTEQQKKADAEKARQRRAAKKVAVAAKPAAAAKVAKVANPLAGLKAAPKGRSLFVNTAGALSVTYRGVCMVLADRSTNADERGHAEKLKARLESRGVA